MRCFCSRNFIFAIWFRRFRRIVCYRGRCLAVGGLIAGFASVLGAKAEDVASQLLTDCPEASGQAAGVSVYFA